VKAAKKATNDICVFMRNTARAHFIRSLPAELMQEAGLRTFDTDNDMLLHFKKYVRFSSKTPSIVTRTTKVISQLCQGMEDEPKATTAPSKQDELDVITSTLQVYGWQRSPRASNDKAKPPFQYFSCSLCS
jgi:hypothetical protein